MRLPWLIRSLRQRNEEFENRGQALENRGQALENRGQALHLTIRLLQILQLKIPTFMNYTADA